MLEIQAASTEKFQTAFHAVGSFSAEADWISIQSSTAKMRPIHFILLGYLEIHWHYWYFVLAKSCVFIRFFPTSTDKKCFAAVETNLKRVLHV